MTIWIITIALNVVLYITILKGLFLTQDTGRLIGQIQRPTKAFRFRRCRASWRG